MAGPALARLYAGRACPALLHATPRAGGRLNADHKALGSAVQEGAPGGAVAGWHRARGWSPASRFGSHAQEAVADAIRLARSCSQKVSGCTVNKAMGPPPGLERAGRTAHGVWTPGAKARTARRNTLIGWTPTRKRSGAPSRTSLTFFGVSPRDAGKSLRQPPGSSRRHHSAAIGITDATLHLLALWKRQQCGRPARCGDESR